MKKLVIFLCIFAALVFAQKPEFQAFAGEKEMLKIGNAKGGACPFIFQAKGNGWSFQAQGQVVPPSGDASVLLDSYLDGNVYLVVAYIPSKAAGTNGKDYEVGMFDARIYMEDEGLETRNVKFKLLPPADDEWANGMATEAASTGAAFKEGLWDGSNDVEITRTAATPLTNEDLNPKPKPVKRVVAPAPAEDKPVVKKRVVKKQPIEEEEEEEPVVRKKKVVKKKKRVVEDDEEEEPVRKKKVVKKKKRVVVEEDDDEDEDEGLTIREKRRRAAARKNAAQYGD